LDHGCFLQVSSEKEVGIVDLILELVIFFTKAGW